MKINPGLRNTVQHKVIQFRLIDVDLYIKFSTLEKKLNIRTSNLEGFKAKNLKPT